MQPIGFSTGAIAKGDLQRALALMRPFQFLAVELSALRLEELPRLLALLPDLDLSGYSHISVHAPSRFDRGDEREVVGLLRLLSARGWPIVVHPDVMFTDALWGPFGNRLWIENSDKRKAVGRTTGELASLFARFPLAKLCFDVGHARQIDSTMSEATFILQDHRTRLRQIHLSEVNAFSRHDPLSCPAVEATRRVAHLIPQTVPVILEPLIDRGQSSIDVEVKRATQALTAAFPIAV